jgi:flagellar biosynthesis chaperone FliJ
MKRFNFRLAPVLRMRRITEDAAKSRLAVANIALRDAIEVRDLERVRCATLTPAPGPETYEIFCAVALTGDLAARSHAQAEAKVAKAAGAAAMAQINWAAAARDVAVLERLADRRLVEHQAAERVADATALDDLVNARYAFDLSRSSTGALR